MCFRNQIKVKIQSLEIFEIEKLTYLDILDDDTLALKYRELIWHSHRFPTCETQLSLRLYFSRIMQIFAKTIEIKQKMDKMSLGQEQKEYFENFLGKIKELWKGHMAQHVFEGIFTFSNEILALTHTLW